jgi:hypothetical protein
MMAFSGFYESHVLPSSGDARGIVPPHRDGHQNGQQEGTFCIYCRHGGRQGDTEQVVA